MRPGPDIQFSTGLMSIRFNSVRSVACIKRSIAMCSQPPIDRDDSELVDINMEAVRLMQPAPKTLGITGGEPTLLGNDLFSLFAVIHDKLPDTNIHMLTNGRRFAWPEFTEVESPGGASR